MALSVVDLYRDVLPRTNCGECSYPTCLAFASMVVSEKHPLKNCPHLSEETLIKCDPILKQQYKDGKWLKKDMAAEALQFAQDKASNISLKALPDRIGGQIVDFKGKKYLKLPYFLTHVLISLEEIKETDSKELTRWEKVFLFNHLAMGGALKPTGTWKSFSEFPNTISKIVSMQEHVEKPLRDTFTGNMSELKNKCTLIGGKDISDSIKSADVAFHFTPMPRTPVRLLFWNEIKQDHLASEVKLLFDETIINHLDLESIVFLSERIAQQLCGTNPKE